MPLSWIRDFIGDCQSFAADSANQILSIRKFLAPGAILALSFLPAGLFSDENCPAGTFGVQDRCWLGGRAAGPMTFAQAGEFCRDFGMVVPGWEIYEQALKSGDERFLTPAMAHLALPDAKINLSGDLQLMRRSVFYVRCAGPAGLRLKKQPSFQRCPPDTLPMKNLCWELPSAPARNRPDTSSPWPQARAFCASHGSRLPTRQEFAALDQTGEGHSNPSTIADGDEVRYVLRGISAWTSEENSGNQTSTAAILSFSSPARFEVRSKLTSAQTVCVTSPAEGN